MPSRRALFAGAFAALLGASIAFAASGPRLEVTYYYLPG
jgi:hypothetical protein